MVSSPPLSSHQPATFAERGVYWPGTTPALAGARVRRGADGLEFVVPNPANGRGVYVLRWPAVRDTLQPTLHDTLLHTALHGAANVTPFMVRAAARQVALDGAAGRAARAAALRAGEADAAARAGTARHVLSVLGTGASAVPETFVDTLSAISIGPDAEEGRLPRLLGQVAALRNALGSARGGNRDMMDAIVTLLDGVMAGGSVLLDAARHEASDVAGLLPLWSSTAPLAVNRPGWFLDGWDVPCLLWQDGGAAALADLCAVLPVLPAEAASWVGRLAPLPAWTGPRAAVPDWRHGLATLDRQARHERMKALAA